MALDIDKKLILAVGALAVLGGAVYLQQKKQTEETQAYSPEGRAKALPELNLSEEKLKEAERITVSTPAGDGGAGLEVVLEKQGEEWRLVKPLSALANQSNVKSVLDNLKTLKVTEEISPSKDGWERAGVSDAKATHVLIQKGNDTLTELWFGEGGTRGQMARLAGNDGVYIVKGYSNFVYQRDIKGWRDLTLLKFDDAKASHVEISNEHGSFAFTKTGTSWSGTFTAAKKGSTAKKIEKLDEAKVGDLLRAYKALNADGFADGKTAADTGLDAPTATLTIKLEDGATYVIQLGKAAEGSSKWAKKSGSEEIFSISSWAADWATAALSKFEKSGDKKEEGGDAPTPPPLDLGQLGGMQ